jgi:hypothetical protein
VGNSPTNFTDPSGLDAYNALNSADQFLAGFADTVTFGGSTALRSHLYGETATRNHSGGYFTAGQVTGAGASIAVGFGAPARLWQGANWAQRTAQIYTAGSTGFASYNSTRKIMNGCGTPLDFLAYAPAAGYLGGRAWLRVTTTPFYTVQGADDLARLSRGGAPWPTAPSRAHLGSGLYAWGNLKIAKQYASLRSSRFPDAGVKIRTYRIPNRDLANLRTKDLRAPMSDKAVNAWLGKHSSLYGDGIPHNFQRVIRETNLGTEHYFTRSIFNRFVDYY